MWEGEDRETASDRPAGDEAEDERSDMFETSKELACCAVLRAVYCVLDVLCCTRHHALLAANRKHQMYARHPAAATTRTALALQIAHLLI